MNDNVKNNEQLEEMIIISNKFFLIKYFNFCS